MVRIILLTVFVVALALLAGICGCTGSHSEGADSAPGGSTGVGVVVSPSPPGSNTTGGTSGTLTGGGTTATVTTNGTTTGTTGYTGGMTATATTGSTGATTGTTGGGNVTQVDVVNSAGAFPYAFTTPISVASGSMVEWINQTSVEHGITWDQQSPASSPPPGANIPIFAAGSSSTAWQAPTVTAQTTYNYHCTVHGTAMSGQIIVTP